jgi:hypothetical protein
VTRWRKSSFSGDSGCVSFASLRGGTIAVRDSKAPEGGTLFLTRGEMAAWLAGIKAGEFDDLVGLDDVS